MKSLIEIEEKVCEVFGVTSEFIHEKSRDSLRFLYRYVIGYVSRKINGKKISLKMLGKYLDIDYSTVHWGIHVVENTIDTDPKFKADMIEVFKRLGEKTNPVDEREEIKKEMITLLKDIYQKSNSIDISAETKHLLYLIEKL